MNVPLRNSFTFGPWTLEKVSDDFDLSLVDCGDADLNEYFQKDSADYRTGCRFVTVDAYQAATPFYERNGFVRTKGAEDGDAPTVPLFFDLLRLDAE